MSRMAVRVGPPVNGVVQALGTDNSLVIPRIISFARDVSPCLVHAKVANAAVLVKLNTIRIFDLQFYEWTQGTTDTDEWYVSRRSGGALVDPQISVAPALLFTAGTSRTKANLGSLTSAKWGYGDNDSLGYSTIYFFGDPTDGGTVMMADDFDGDSDDDGVGHIAIPKGESQDVSMGGMVKIQSVSFVTLHASDDLDTVSIVGWEA